MPSKQSRRRSSSFSTGGLLAPIAHSNGHLSYRDSPGVGCVEHRREHAVRLADASRQMHKPLWVHSRLLLSEVHLDDAWVGPLEEQLRVDTPVVDSDRLDTARVIVLKEPLPRLHAHSVDLHLRVSCSERRVALGRRRPDVVAPVGRDGVRGAAWPDGERAVEQRGAHGGGGGLAAGGDAGGGE